MSDNQNRKRSVILFADIVGYTSLMQKHEVNANVLLEKFYDTLKLKSKIFKDKLLSPERAKLN